MNRKILWELALCFFVLIGLSACSSDDDGFSSNNLIGTWELTYFEEWETKNGEYDHQTQTDYTTSSNSKTYTFHKDGTLTCVNVYSGRERTYNGTWAIKGSKLYYSESGEYEYDDDYEIKTLNKNTLIYELSFTEYESGDKWTFFQQYVFQKISDDDE